MSLRKLKARALPANIDCVSQDEAMARLGVSRQTLYRWRRDGRLVCISKFGRVRVSVDSIRQLFADA